MTITLIELFSGIGGFTKGLQDAGFTTDKHYYSEVDKHAIANYKYNFPDATYIGSVANVRHIIRTINANRLATDTVYLTFGSPCQDFSLAGKGLGLDGTKSSLIKYAIFLIKWLKPDVYIWENVKGAYSTNNSNDYWAITKAFANLDGYRQEQQLLNTAWVLPQNRERIYAIGHLDGRSEPRVFPITESVGRADERATETPIVRTITAGGHSGGHHSSMTLVRHRSTEPYKVSDCSPTIRNGDKGEIRIITNTKQGYDIATEGDSINLSVPNSTTRRGRVGKGIANTLDTQSNQAVCVAQRGRGEGNVQQLEARTDTNTITGVSKDNMIMQINRSKESGGKQPFQQNRVYDKAGVSPCLDQGAGKWQINDTNIRRLTEIECERLQGFDNSWRDGSEPANWTMWGVYEKQVWINKKEGTFKIVEGKGLIPKTQRYKLLGNAVTSAIVKLIGKKLLNK